MGYGRFFEEFTEGEVIRHWPGRTITETDCTWFALLTMNQHPVHSDAHYAATRTPHEQRLVLGPLVFSIGIGMTVADVSGRAIANLEIEKITHDHPTFIGDTLYSESTVLALRESRKGDRGTVRVETRVTNQHGVRVMTFRRTALVPKRTHATLGEGSLP
ncbi:MAG: MaoC family dehydratase [Candidatus Rokubacteria bacterium]|nr:MaoC family dehydratase [Candidatus Rokubacteria bacterium]